MDAFSETISRKIWLRTPCSCVCVALSATMAMQALGATVGVRYGAASTVVTAAGTAAPRAGNGGRGGGNPMNPTPGAGTPGQGNPGSGNPGKGSGGGGKNEPAQTVRRDRLVLAGRRSGLRAPPPTGCGALTLEVFSCQRARVSSERIQSWAMASTYPRASAWARSPNGDGPGAFDSGHQVVHSRSVDCATEPF